MKTSFLNACLILLVCAAQNSEQQDKPRVQNKGAGVSQEILSAYEAHVFDGMPYRLLLPATFESTRKYPLILNLHGGAGVGNDNESNLRSWSAKFVDAGWRVKYPCIVVVPQSTGSWSVTSETVPELTEALKKTFSEAWQTRIEGYVTQYSSPRCDKTANVWDWLFAQRLDKR